MGWSLRHSGCYLSWRSLSSNWCSIPPATPTYSRVALNEFFIDSSFNHEWRYQFMLDCITLNITDLLTMAVLSLSSGVPCPMLCIYTNRHRVLVISASYLFFVAIGCSLSPAIAVSCPRLLFIITICLSVCLSVCFSHSLFPYFSLSLSFSVNVWVCVCVCVC